MRRPVLNIDLNALIANYRMLRAKCPGECGATVKANAYGLGVEHVAPALAASGCGNFFVATLDEAIALRRLLPLATIYVFAGFECSETALFIENKVRPVLNTISQISDWAQKTNGAQAAIHIDTGMNRLGLTPGEAKRWAGQGGAFPGLKNSLLMTHLGFADAPDDPRNDQQIETFQTIAQALPLMKTSIGNSAGILNGRAFCGDLARPGIALYGGNPWNARQNPMQPVIRLEAPILQARTIEPGDSVGYSGTFTARETMRVATIGIGYADGLTRRCSNQAFMRISGYRCSIIGRISMDTTVIDVTSVPEAILNGALQAEIIGETSVDEFAQWFDTIAYEALTSLGDRVEGRHCSLSGVNELNAPARLSSLSSYELHS